MTRIAKKKMLLEKGGTRSVFRVEETYHITEKPDLVNGSVSIGM